MNSMSRARAAILALSALAGLWLAATLPLADPDEGRNAEVMREMAATGDVVIPHLAGLPYLDKPPALFAAGALAVRALGHTPLAARLPSLLAALATLAIVGAAARRREGERHATATTALLAGAPLFVAMSAYVIFDMPLALCVTAFWTALLDEPGERT